MPMWRCPHCGTPQAETSRCWVCKRSSTSCGTCRHFRRAIAGQLGYCGLDRFRRPLRGDELRGCWESTPAGLEPEPSPARHGPLPPARPLLVPGTRPRIDFVELDLARPTAPAEREPRRTRTRDNRRRPAAAAPAPAAARDPALGFWAEEA